MKRALVAAAAVLLLAGIAAAAFALYRYDQGQDVRGSSEEFVVTDIPPAPKPVKRKGRKPADIPWPTYGFDEARLRVAPYRLRPPYRRLWTFKAQSLLEFPPAIGYGRLYFVNNNGVVFAVNARTGKRAWKHRSGRCAASSPAIARGLVYVTFLNRPPCNANRKGLEGEIVAFSAGFGKVLWRTRLGPTESSPLVANGLVYVGDWRGRVYALGARDGKVRWTFSTGDQVKGALALAHGRVYVGSYDHHLYALDALTGKRIWRAGAQKRLGPRGTFYSTPAVAYNRVYVGGTDGKVYSYGATSGKLRWSHYTNNYVYSSPAVWQRRVFVGSYSGTFYAFDAATGDIRWSFQANGPISGSPTVIAGVVYFATLKRRTYALEAATGRQLWSWPDGKYSPVVADSERLYLVGYARVYALESRPR